MKNDTAKCDNRKLSIFASLLEAHYSLLFFVNESTLRKNNNKPTVSLEMAYTRDSRRFY